MSDENIAVIPKAVLDELGYFTGFSTDIDKYKELLHPRDVRFLPRKQMEEDPAFKQLIPYMVLGKILGHGEGRHAVFMSYCRGAGQDEARLHGKYSVGIGGHVNDQDVGADENPFQAGMMRELIEEVTLTPVIDPMADWERPVTLPQPVIDLLGFVNYDDDEVGQVHLGVVYVLWVDGYRVMPNEPDINDVRWLDTGTLLKDRENYETWSQICIDQLQPVTK